MAIKIDKVVLEQACKEIIETILFCLPNAYKGTVYRVGNPPEMPTKRITSGIIDEERKTISWGLPERSDYNPPGKPWLTYRDEPDRALEAMAWCIEMQKSWTAEDPKNDSRSVRLQEEGELQDFHHMEPVLIRKEDLYLGNEPNLTYPKNFKGETLWQNSDYVVVAVIKIHFRPNTIKVGSPETRVIKRLSRALGTELLSYEINQQSIEAMRQLAEDKLKSCNILSDSLRNAITKSGLIFSLIKLELGFLRGQWEEILLKHSDQKGVKHKAIQALNRELRNMDETANGLGKDLIETQNRFLELSLPPEGGENWVRMQIEERWNKLLSEVSLDKEQIREIRIRIDQLKKSLYLGKDPDIVAAYDKMHHSLKDEWINLIYRNTDRVDLKFLDRLIHVLEDRTFNLPHKEKSRKSLIRLKVLAEIMDQLEQKTNVVLREVLNGNGNGMSSHVINGQAIS